MGRCRTCECVRDDEDTITVSALWSEEVAEAAERIVLLFAEEVEARACGGAAMAEEEEADAWACGRVELVEEDTKGLACGRVVPAEAEDLGDIEAWACGRVVLTEEEETVDDREGSRAEVFDVDMRAIARLVRFEISSDCWTDSARRRSKMRICSRSDSYLSSEIPRSE